MTIKDMALTKEKLLELKRLAELQTLNLRNDNSRLVQENIRLRTELRTIKADSPRILLEAQRFLRAMNRIGGIEK